MTRIHTLRQEVNTLTHILISSVCVCWISMKLASCGSTIAQLLSHTHTHTPSLIQPTESLHWYKSSPRRHSQEDFSHFSLNVWTLTAVDFLPPHFLHTNTHTHVSLCLSISCPLCFFSLSGLFYLPNLLLFFFYFLINSAPLSLSARLVRYYRLLLHASALVRNILFFGKIYTILLLFSKHSHMRAYLNPNHFHVRSLLVSILTFPRPIGPSRTSWLPTVLLSSCIFLVSSLSDSLKRWSLLSCFSKKGQKSQNGG